LSEYQQVPPEAFASNQSGYMGEHIVRTETQEVLAIPLKFVAGRMFLRETDFVGGDAVVDDVNIRGFELRSQESHLLRHGIPDRIDAVAVLGCIDEGVFEVRVLISEDFVDVEMVSVGLTHDVVEHRVVPRVLLDNSSYGRHFVSIEGGGEVAVGFQLRGQRRGHSHELMGENYCSSLGDPQSLESRDGRRREADVLFVFPEVFVKIALNPELIEEPAFEFVEQNPIGVADVEQQNLRGATDGGLIVNEGPTAVYDADVEEALYPSEGGAVVGMDQTVERRIDHFAAGAQAIL